MADATCSIEGCETKVRSRGWCNRHYRAWRTHGDPLGSAPPRTSNVTADGYRRINTPGHPMANDRGWAPEHRVIAWDHFGPFDPNMHVHHVNHDRLDNRPENLEVITASEHMRRHGQENRVIDYHEAVVMYEGGLSTPTIASLLGTTHTVIRYALIASGVKLRPSGAANRVVVDDDLLIRLHGSPGYRVPQIAAELGVSHAVVRRAMRDLSLRPFRPGAPT